MGKFLIAVVVFILLCIVLTIATCAMSARKRKRFSDRRRLNTTELFELFSGASSLPNSDLKILLEIIANETDVPLGFLRPEDRFGHELAPEKGWEFDDGINFLPLAIAQEFGGRFEQFNLVNNPTIADIVRAVGLARNSIGSRAEIS